jgi:hypothetical protein
VRTLFVLFRVWVENIEQHSARVMFVDYGNTDVVAVDSLQSLPNIFWHIRPLAVPFRLQPCSTVCGGMRLISVSFL